MFKKEESEEKILNCDLSHLQAKIFLFKFAFFWKIRSFKTKLVINSDFKNVEV